MRTEKYLQALPASLFAVPPKIIRLPDGTLMATVWPFQAAPRSMQVAYSRDQGNTWSDPVALFDFADITPGQVLGAEAVVDMDGEVHFFMTHQWKPDFKGEGERGGPGAYDGQRIDLWHARSTHQRSHWTRPHRFWQGYTGSLNSCLILRTGRIVLPFSYYVNRTWGNRGQGFEAFTFFGMFLCATLCSDDGGETWTQSNDVKVVTPDIVGAYGACEPVCLELADGRVWMLIRTQRGRFYESFSPDGLEWTKPTPSSITSSDSPAGLVRLQDGRIVLIWNNCLRFPYAYGGRQVIHAAISDDEGQTWRGYREVGWDPHRDAPPPPSGDFGAGYPYPVVTAGSQILISTGQGEGRTLLTRLDPRFLEVSRQSADFTRGMDDWSTFGTRGVSVMPHPERTGQKVLSLQRVDPEYPASAVWNFPAGNQGRLSLRLFIQPGCQGVRIGLTDHFSTPYDYEDILFNAISLTVSESATTKDSLSIPAGRWVTLEFRWNCARRQCVLRLNAEKKLILPLQHSATSLSYLRLCAVAERVESQSVWVEAVDVKVRPLKKRDG